MSLGSGEDLQSLRHSQRRSVAWVPEAQGRADGVHEATFQVDGSNGGIPDARGNVAGKRGHVLTRNVEFHVFKA